MDIEIATNADLGEDEVIDLYRANAWSAADKPAQLLLALKNSHTLVTARISGRLVGIANAISDGHLVVYYPHMLVHPEFQKRGIGRRMIAAMQSIYENYHQQMLTADGEAVHFYEALGFKRAGKTELLGHPRLFPCDFFWIKYPPNAYSGERERSFRRMVNTCTD